MVFINEYITCL